MRLSADEGVQGFNKEFKNVNDMRAVATTLIDENVIGVSIKKRAVKNNAFLEERGKE